MTSNRAVGIGFALLGVAVSTYLAVVHFTEGQVPLLCSSGGLVNCERVTTSPESTIGPVPVAVLGVVWFGVILALAIVPGEALPESVSLARLIWSLGGLLVVLYLIYAELFLIGAICLWCTVVHVLVIALFLLTLAQATVATPEADGTEASLPKE